MYVAHSKYDPFKFAHLQSTTWSSILNKHSFISSAGCHYEERTVFHARPPRPGSCNLWSSHLFWRMSLHQQCQIRGLHASQEAFDYSLSTTQPQPDIMFVFSNSTFWMRWSFIPVYHVPRIGRIPRVQWCLGAKLFSCSLMFTHVFLCTNLISNYPCSFISNSTKFSIGIKIWDRFKIPYSCCYCS